MVGEVGVMCDLRCRGGFIRCSAAPGVERLYIHMIYKLFIVKDIRLYL